MVGKRSGFDRRNFLKHGLLGAAGIGAFASLPSALKGANQAGAAAPQGQTKKEGLITRKLGKTGVILPVVSMGVMNSDNDGLVKAALDAGLIHLDTAHGYMRGRNEEMIGRVIKDKPRDSYFIATKVPPTNAQRFLEMVDLSLKRLGLDHVDILYVHGVDDRDAVLSVSTMKAVETAKKSGKARFVGVSTHSNEHEVIRAVVESKFYDVVLAAYNFKKNNLVELNKAIAEAAKAGVGLIAMKTLAGNDFDSGGGKGSGAKAALKWALSNPDITTAIPGMTAFDQLELDVQVARDISLTDEEKKILKLVPEQGGLYCQQCNGCLPQCPNGLPIPSLMRSYMYAFGYKNFGEAYDLVASLRVPENPCGNCAGCTVKCVQGFNVRERVTDIARLQAVPAHLFA